MFLKNCHVIHVAKACLNKNKNVGRSNKNRKFIETI